MRVLVFGVTGMLGHVVWQTLKSEFDVYGTVRQKKDDLLRQCPLFVSGRERIIDQIDALAHGAIDGALDLVNPEVVINCIGIIKQLDEANDPLLCISLNALFPHVLAKKCKERNIRMIHISTDCVFSGNTGMYIESDVSDAADLYGKTKCLGETKADNCLTIRTSLIGRELKNKKSLLEWFLSQRGKVKGYKRAIFSGLTTHAFADIVRTIMQRCPELSGIYHVASEPICKYDLLMRLREHYQVDLDIDPDEKFAIDRSLDPGKFKTETSIIIPNWQEMINELPLKGE